MEERQGETGLELDEDRRLLAADGDHICRADLRLDLVALLFEKALDRDVKRRLTHSGQSSLTEV
jgi:hypothetical protein